MKSRTLMFAVGIVLLAAPVRLAAQQHHHYKFIDLGTFGGPNSGLDCCGIIPPVLNNQGVVVGGADTSAPNPSVGNWNPLLCCEAFVNPAFQWQSGVLANLGALPGGFNSFPNSVNARGDVVGTAENGEADPLQGFPESHPVLWKHGVAVDLGTLGGFNGLAFAINNGDEVVGFVQNNIPDPFGYFGFAGQSRAFLWKDGLLRDLGTLGEGNDAFATFVNERGQVAGFSYTDSTPTPNSGSICPPNVPTQHPFLWENGRILDLGTLGGNCAAPAAINNRGQVAGNSDLGDPNAFPHAFLWSPETGMKDLGTLGGTFAQADDLTDNGEVVGASTVQNDLTFHAFLWRKGRFTDLGNLPGDCASGAYAINSKSQIVGDSFTCAFPPTHPFLWENGQIISLQAFVPSTSGFTLAEPSFINDQGEIAGYGFLTNGDARAFILIPCDENHPDVKGCDYSLVEASVTATVSTMPTTRLSPDAIRQLMQAAGRHSKPWYRGLGVQSLPK